MQDTRTFLLQCVLCIGEALPAHAGCARRTRPRLPCTPPDHAHSTPPCGSDRLSDARAEYFPFDDVLAKAMEHSGVMPTDLGPLTDFFEAAADHPLMPSGAAIFVSAVVMLLDFSRPRWQPVTLQARDWVVRCLKMCAPLACCDCWLLALNLAAARVQLNTPCSRLACASLRRSMGSS